LTEKIDYQAIADELRVHARYPDMFNMTPGEYLVAVGIQELAAAIERVGRANG
jgi:hypothetical protein